MRFGEWDFAAIERYQQTASDAAPGRTRQNTSHLPKRALAELRNLMPD
jgi:hypothetical protein